MCWNQYISLNTFTFSVFVLMLIAYNNKYSPYKMEEFNNVFVYLFFMSFIAMQLIEFFIWRNLKHADMNRKLSIAGALLLMVQPIASLMLLQNIGLRNAMLATYAIPAIVYFIYKVNTQDKFNTTVTKTGHLHWNWLNLTESKLLGVVWFLFLYFSIFAEKQYFVAGFITVVLLAASYYSYNKEGSYGSLWCWSINSLMIFYAIKLLVVLPYKEHGLCL
jgi:hypothetical protein